MVTASRRALRRILSTGNYTTAELAEVAGTSGSAIQKAASCVEENSDLSAARYELLARYLCSHGERRLSAAYVSPDCEIRLVSEDAAADGRVDDELRSLLEVGGRISSAHRSRDAETVEGAVQELETILARLRAEGRLIR